MISLLSEGFRHIEWLLRNWKQHSAPGFKETNEPKDDFFQNTPKLALQEKELLHAYPDLVKLRKQATLSRYLENLNFVEALHTMLPADLPLATHSSPVACLEIGIKNWSTVHGLVSVLNVRTQNNYTLTGIELDPWRRYTDGHSRWDYAKYYTHKLPHTTLVTGNALDHHGTYDVIVMWLPFLFEEPHAKWGLPASLFAPEELFEHIITHLLAPGGILLLANQDRAEFYEQSYYLPVKKVTTRFSGPLNQSFLKWEHTRYGYCVQKEKRGL